MVFTRQYSQYADPKCSYVHTLSLTHAVPRLLTPHILAPLILFLGTGLSLCCCTQICAGLPVMEPTNREKKSTIPVRNAWMNEGSSTVRVSQVQHIWNWYKLVVFIWNIVYPLSIHSSLILDSCSPCIHSVSTDWANLRPVPWMSLALQVMSTLLKKLTPTSKKSLKSRQCMQLLYLQSSGLLANYTRYVSCVARAKRTLTSLTYSTFTLRNSQSLLST